MSDMTPNTEHEAWGALQGALAAHDSPVPEGAWAKIAEQRRRRRRAFWWWVLPFLAAVPGGLGWWWQAGTGWPETPRAPETASVTSKDRTKSEPQIRKPPVQNQDPAAKPSKEHVIAAADEVFPPNTSQRSEKANQPKPENPGTESGGDAPAVHEPSNPPKRSSDKDPSSRKRTQMVQSQTPATSVAILKPERAISRQERQENQPNTPSDASISSFKNEADESEMTPGNSVDKEVQKVAETSAADVVIGKPGAVIELNRETAQILTAESANPAAEAAPRNLLDTAGVAVRLSPLPLADSTGKTVTPIAPGSYKPKRWEWAIRALGHMLQVGATAPAIQDRTTERLQSASLPSPVGFGASLGVGYRLGYGLRVNTRIGLAGVRQQATYRQVAGPDSPIQLIYSADSQQVSSEPILRQEVSRQSTLLVGMADLGLAWRLHRWEAGASAGYIHPVAGDMKLSALSLEGNLARALGQRLWLIGTMRRAQAGRYALPGQEKAKGSLMLYGLGLQWTW